MTCSSQSTSCISAAIEYFLIFCRVHSPEHGALSRIWYTLQNTVHSPEQGTLSRTWCTLQNMVHSPEQGTLSRTCYTLQNTVHSPEHCRTPYTAAEYGVLVEEWGWYLIFSDVRRRVSINQIIVNVVLISCVRAFKEEKPLT